MCHDSNSPANKIQYTRHTDILNKSQCNIQASHHFVLELCVQFRNECIFHCTDIYQTREYHRISYFISCSAALEAASSNQLFRIYNPI